MTLAETSGEQPIPHDQLVKVLTDQCQRHVETITELRERIATLTEDPKP